LSSPEDASIHRLGHSSPTGGDESKLHIVFLGGGEDALGSMRRINVEDEGAWSTIHNVIVEPLDGGDDNVLGDPPAR
jgi:hypothetical protein